MATKLSRMVIYTWRTPNNKVTQPPDHVVLQSHMTSKYHYIPATKVPMATKLDRMVTHFARLLTVKAFYARSRDKQKSLYIHNQSAYGYKLDRMINYLDEFLPIVTSTFDHVVWQKSHDKLKPLYLPYQCLWLTNFLVWWHTLTGS